MYGTDGIPALSQENQPDGGMSTNVEELNVEGQPSQDAPKSLVDIVQDLVNECMDPTVFEHANGQHTKKFFTTAVAEYNEMVVASVSRYAGEQPAEAYGWMISTELNASGRTVISRTSPIGVMRIIRHSRSPLTIDDLTQRLSEGVGYKGDISKLRGYVVAQVATIVGNAFGEDNKALRSHLRLGRRHDDAATISFIP